MRQKDADADQSEQRRCCVDHRTQSYAHPFHSVISVPRSRFPGAGHAGLKFQVVASGQARLDRTSMAIPPVRRKGAAAVANYREWGALVPCFAV
jgi:hypothetical protein